MALAHRAAWMRTQKPTGPCPRCGLHVQWGDRQCPHCGHQLTQADIDDIKSYISEQKALGIKRAIIWVPLMFAVLTGLFYVLG